MKARLSALALATLVSAGAASAQDWNGFYGGLALSRLQGDWQHLDPNGVVTVFGHFLSDSVAGGFAGYNFQPGQMVYGVEIAAMNADGFCFSDYPTECTTDLVDLKARVGYAVGSALFYAVAGKLKAIYFDTIDLTGTAYGLGVDYSLSDRLFVGGEILRREVDGPFNFTYRTEHSIDSLTLRLGMKF